MAGKRKRKRKGAQEPRVDDLFYGSPTPEPESEPESEPDDAATEGRDDGGAHAVAGLGERGAGPGPNGPGEPPIDGPQLDESSEGAGQSTDADAAQAQSHAAEEHSYAARADRGASGDDEAGGGMLSRRGRSGGAGRWARAVAIAGLGAALVYGAGSGRLGTVDLAAALGGGDAVSQQITQRGGLAVISDSTLGCVGPGLVGLDNPSVPETDQGVSVSAGSAPIEALPEGVAAADDGGVTLSGVPDGDASEVGARGEVATLSAEGSTWVRASAQGALAAGFAGTQLGYSFEEQQWGMATATCGAALDDVWLVGGGDETGRVERLILANPTGNPVSVSAEVLGAAGPVSVVGGTGIVVPPAGRQVVLLDALAPGEERPVVHVTTTGGPVVAALGDRWLEGTVDRGTEVTTATAAPATSLVIPAVPAPRPDTADVATVRVAAPGTEAAVVQLRALTPEGPVRLEQGVTNVAPGSVVDVDVADLPAGTQGVEVTADTPVLAAAHVQRRAEPEGVGDLAWIPATTPTSSLLGAPLATSADGAIAGSLSVTSPEGATVEVFTVAGGALESSELPIPAASSHTVDLPAQTQSVWVQPIEGTVSAAVVSTLEHKLGTLIAGLPLPEAPVTREVREIAPWMP